MSLEAFQSLIDAYGADSRRWPDGRRQQAEALLLVSAEAVAMQKQARVLDRLIGQVPRPGDARLAALTERIMEQSLREPVTRRPEISNQSGDNVVHLPVGRARNESPRSQPSDTTTLVDRARPKPGLFRPAAALAASLVLGIVIGLTDLTPVSQLGGYRQDTASLSDAELVLSGLQNDTLSLFDEDQL